MIVFDLVLIAIAAFWGINLNDPASGFDPEPQKVGGDGGGAAAGARCAARVTRGAIVVIFLLLANGNIGVDTTPLLADAGIVGLAIGFGAQKQVTEVVSGVFFLIDDAFRTGNTSSLRRRWARSRKSRSDRCSGATTRARCTRSPTAPCGETPRITNYSRD